MKCTVAQAGYNPLILIFISINISRYMYSYIITSHLLLKYNVCYRKRGGRGGIKIGINL